jgi:glycosyltransferase involved in cell wall biosynthesis
MKIAYVYDAVYPWIKGGAEKRIYEISKRLVERGHEVHWFGIKWWDGNSTIEQNGVYLHGVCEPQELYVEGRRSIPEAIYFARKLLFPLLKEDLDIVDCYAFPYFPSFSAKLCSLLKRTPLVITWLEVWDDYWYDYLRRKGVFGKVVEKLTSKLSKAIITISEKVKNDLISIGVNQGKIRVIPDGIDFESIQKIKPSKKRYDTLYVGRLIKHKNADVLIRAIDTVKKEMPDIKCGIIGDGPERENLTKLTKDVNLERNIDFLGFLEEDKDVISYMKSSKVFVFPSTREGAGLVTLEANACGLPVITVNHEKNAVVEVVINEENGFICELSDRDIAKRILVALDNRGNMRRNCIEFSRKYDWNRMADLTESTYEELLK